jgi:hypothetical protein
MRKTEKEKDAELEAAHKMLEEVSRKWHEENPPGPLKLNRKYLRNVAWQESLPDNQSGSDKTWVERTLWRDMDWWYRVRRRGLSLPPESE